MGSVFGWSEDELERRSATLAALIRKLWRTIARSMSTSFTMRSVVTPNDAHELTGLWIHAIDQYLIDEIAKIYVNAAETILAAVPATVGTLIGDDLIDLHVKEARNRLVGVGDDVWQTVQEQIALGQADGESVKQIAARVQNVTGVSDARAAIIARTETHAAHEAGSFAQALFVDPDGTKEWLATNDTRTRHTHRVADGQRARIGESFIVGSTALRYPGDPLGDPSETINCRCSVSYEFDDIITSMDGDDVGDQSPTEFQQLMASLATTAAAFNEALVVPSDSFKGLIAFAKKWSPENHPRGNDGKFIKKGGVSTLLSKNTPLITDVLNAVTDLSPEGWSKLTESQKAYITDSIDKLPAPYKKITDIKLSKIKTLAPSPSVKTSPSTSSSKININPAQKIPAGLKGKPGDPAKITTSVVWGKHAPGTVVVESEFGTDRIVWDGKKYQVQALDEQDNWVNQFSLTKKSFYEDFKNDTGWVVPGGDKSKSPAVDFVQDIGELSTAINEPKSADATPETSASLVDFSGFKQVSGQAGSNPGGVYQDPVTGDKYYVKKAKTADHAANEVAASRLYNLVGIKTPLVEEGFGAPGLPGDLHTGTKLVPGAKTDFADKVKDPAYRKKVQEGFVVDAWLANWDVAGLVFDNIVTDEDGNPARIDVGGTLLFRAQGAPKGAAFGDQVTELDTLRDPYMNPVSAQVFGDMTDAEIAEAAKRVTSVTDQQIDDIVLGAGLPASVALTLKNRRDYIASKYPLTSNAVIDVPKTEPSTAKILSDKNKKFLLSEIEDGANLTENEAISLVNSLTNDDTKNLTYVQIAAISQSINAIDDNDEYSAASTKWTALVNAKFAADASTSNTSSTPISTPETPKTSKPIGVVNNELEISNWQFIANSIYPSGYVIAKTGDDDKQLIKGLGTNVFLQELSPTLTGDAIWKTTNILSQSDLAFFEHDEAWYVPANPTNVSTITSVTPTTPTAKAVGVGGGDISAIPGWKKNDWKASLKFSGNTGYWSKPEKIWDVIKTIQIDEEKAGNQYTPLQIIKALDSTLKTSTPNPYETKMTKWAATKKGQSYIALNGGTGLTNPSSDTTPAGLDSPQASQIIQSVSTGLNMGSGDVSHLSDEKMQSLYTTFKKQPSTYLSSQPSDIYAAVKTIASDNGLDTMQMIKVIDIVGAKKVNKPNQHLFEKKIQDWLKTPKGAAVASGVPMPKPPTPALKKGIAANIPSFDASSTYTYNVLPVTEANAWFDEVKAKHGQWTGAEQSGLKAYTGGTYYSINAYLWGHLDNISTTNENAMNNAQKGMRPSEKPILLHRGTGYDGVGGAKSFADIEKMVGQTWKSEGFMSTSVGGKAAFSSNPVIIEVEAPPGTPMAFVKPISYYSSENEMLLAAGLNYKIISAKQVNGKSYVRVRVVPMSEEAAGA